MAGILATVITDTINQMAARLARLVRFRREDPLVRQIMLGFHVEGPFINETPGYVVPTRPSTSARLTWTR